MGGYVRMLGADGSEIGGFDSDAVIEYAVPDSGNGGTRITTSKGGHNSYHVAVEDPSAVRVVLEAAERNEPAELHARP